MTSCNFFKLLAKAIYDNIAESTDELAFRKGDILTVIETDTSDLKGWWLCQLRGRQGFHYGVWWLGKRENCFALAE
ncbi:conserved hypothetical protein [Culex quinquefasciatus]|uniref:SH3 domain-containing protein n=1 Tax=Culex quinquefasciatus TaxID=7176 RepID=B0VZF0_CULQU|nr:conserved hypothetical protein [Culex quinquefasciatus]|eukprot:XP_001841834.1 conserved hypothetical protein [Culex quinquefasciatus]